MKIILLEDIKNIGSRMDVKDVSDGYARNFLIPKGLARLADTQSLQMKAAWEAEHKQLIGHYEELARRLKDVTLEFQLAVGAKGEVFGSVKSADIRKALLDQGFKEGEVVLVKPFKTLGEHSVQINLRGGIKSQVKVILKALPSPL